MRLLSAYIAFLSLGTFVRVLDCIFFSGCRLYGFGWSVAVRRFNGYAMLGYFDWFGDSMFTGLSVFKASSALQGSRVKNAGIAVGFQPCSGCP